MASGMQEPGDSLGPTSPPDSPCPPGTSGLSESQDLQENPDLPGPSVSPGPPGPAPPAHSPVSPDPPKPDAPPGPPSPPDTPSLPKPAVLPPGPTNPPGPSGILESLGLSKVPVPLRRLRQERTVYTKEQQEELEKVFCKTKYPTFEEHTALAGKLNVQYHQIQVWFKNRRAKLSRQQLRQKLAQESCASASLAAPGCRAPPGGLCGSVFSVAPGFRSLASGPSGVFSAAKPHFSGHGQAWASLGWGAQEGNAAAWPQGPHVPEVAPDTKFFPYFPKIVSALDPCEKPVVPANMPACPFGGVIGDEDKPGAGHY